MHRKLASPSRGLLLSVVAVVISIAVVGVAGADTFTGETSQDRRVRLVTDRSDVPKTFAISWKTRKCRRTGNEFEGPTRFPGFDLANDSRFRSKGKYEVTQSQDGFKSLVRVRVAGERAGKRRWRGTFSATANVQRRGKPYDRCVLRPVSWRAKASNSPRGTRAPVPGAGGLRTSVR